MTRRGKIARLPQTIREQINRRLQNGEEGGKIAEWLNTLPEVQALMTAEFDGQPINEPNLSHWKLGGYADWQEQQDSLDAVCRFGEDALELSQSASAPLADQLALCLTARLAVALRQRPDAAGDPAAQLQRLRHLCADLVRLRRGDHNAQWLRLEATKNGGLAALGARKAGSQRQKIRRRHRRPNKGGRRGARDPTEDAATKETLEQVSRDLHLL